MVAFNFKNRFAAAVQAGVKTQTMRAGEQRASIGDDIQLYTGQRTKECRKLGDGVLTALIPVTLTRHLFIENGIHSVVRCDLDKFAQRDGFTDWNDLADFFFGDMPSSTMYEVWLYRWKLV